MPFSRLLSCLIKLLFSYMVYCYNLIYIRIIRGFLIRLEYFCYILIEAIPNNVITVLGIASMLLKIVYFYAFSI